MLLGGPVEAAQGAKERPLQRRRPGILALDWSQYWGRNRALWEKGNELLYYCIEKKTNLLQIILTSCDEFSRTHLASEGVELAPMEPPAIDPFEVSRWGLGAAGDGHADDGDVQGGGGSRGAEAGAQHEGHVRQSEAVPPPRSQGAPLLRPLWDPVHATWEDLQEEVRHLLLPLRQLLRGEHQSSQIIDLQVRDVRDNSESKGAGTFPKFLKRQRLPKVR